MGRPDGLALKWRHVGLFAVLAAIFTASFLYHRRTGETPPTSHRSSGTPPIEAGLALSQDAVRAQLDFLLSAPASPEASAALAKARERPEPFVYVLQSLLSDVSKTERERLAAIQLLGSLPCERSVQVVLQCYPSFASLPGLRREAVDALVRMQGFGAFNALVTLLGVEPEMELQERILSALGVLAEEKDLPKLGQALARLPPSLRLSDAQCKALDQAGSRPAVSAALQEVQQAAVENPAGLRQLQKALGNPLPIAQIAAVQKLAGSGRPEALEAVVNWVFDSRPGYADAEAMEQGLVSLSQVKGDEVVAMMKARVSQEDAATVRLWERFIRLRQDRSLGLPP